MSTTLSCTQLLQQVWLQNLHSLSEVCRRNASTIWNVISKLTRHTFVTPTSATHWLLGFFVAVWVLYALVKNRNVISCCVALYHVHRVHNLLILPLHTIAGISQKYDNRPRTLSTLLHSTLSRTTASMYLERAAILYNIWVFLFVETVLWEIL